MSDDSFAPTRNRLVVEGEQLVLANIAPGATGFIPLNDVGLALKHSWMQMLWRRIARYFAIEGAPDPPPSKAAWVPSRTHLILKNIPKALQQRYGLEEQEGAVYLRSGVDDSQVELRFNNGALIKLQDLRIGQVVEVLSLAGTRATLFEEELQAK